MPVGVQHQVWVTVLMGLGVAKQYSAGELEYSHAGVQGLRDRAVPITHPSSSIAKLNRPIKLARDFIHFVTQAL
jgi:hypothetical protein